VCPASPHDRPCIFFRSARGRLAQYRGSLAMFELARRISHLTVGESPTCREKRAVKKSSFARSFRIEKGVGKSKRSLATPGGARFGHHQETGCSSVI
jgi:hypothetical protein